MTHTVLHGLRHPARLAICGATLLCVASSALAEAPLPRPRPSIADTFASSCTAPDPELAYAALPRSLREVPLRRMIGQLLVVSYSGTRPTDAGVLAARDAIAEGRIGGVLTFRHNIGSAADIAAVNASFAQASEELLPMIAVDQEGGVVMRVKPSEGAPATPSAAEVAATSPREAAATYAAMATRLAELGFTANFGPVVDLAVNPDNPVIAGYRRSYGDAPAVVADYARAFVAAHRSSGVGTALKHFPGHGSSTDDSHDRAIDLTPTWRRAEMAPFRTLIATGEADMVMAGHLTLDGITGPDGLPASLSPQAIDGFLRETLCFGGVVVSDDLAMNAVSSRWDAATAVRMMIEAGGDVALLSLPSGQGLSTVDAIIDDLAERAAASRAFADRIRHAYARVAHHKLDLAETPASTADTREAQASLAR